MVEDRDIIAMIDHAVLAPDSTRDDVLAACALAAELGVAGVCVHPRWVRTAAEALAGSGVATGTVAGFPLGANTSETKAAEAREAIVHGADEIDMVMAITAFKSGDRTAVLDDIAAVVGAAYAAAAEQPVVKVILEMCYLTLDEKRVAAELAVEAGADFLKTSTGLGGGIRTLSDARALVTAGATRIGTSSTRAIADELGLR